MRREKKLSSPLWCLAILFLLVSLLITGCGDINDHVHEDGSESETSEPSLALTYPALEKSTSTLSPVCDSTAPQPVITQTTRVCPSSIPSPTPETKRIDESVSPDGRWKVILLRTFDEGEERSIFKVVLDLDDVVWIVEDVPYEDIPVSGFPFPRPFAWSGDGRMFYYIYESSGDGCFGVGKRGLQRLDLATGQVTEIFSDAFRWMTFSPDEKNAAILVGSGELIILDLLTGQEDVFDPLISREDAGMEIAQGNVVWSPDGQRLIFDVAAGVCDLPDGYFNWIIRVDLAVGTQTILAEKDERVLVPVAWPQSDRVLVRQSQQLFWMDPETAEIEPVE